ncbi:MAG: phosphate ABC transporter substrate-binding protein, PhoT family [Bacteroidetes bacterium]|nr:MAG: phosphate ABC transporter substrate-binding protein, PhoT family [Bacteroidota bacterium]REK00754.1 MAG: phosphate ABC transporter substrate-binding protein, PhoT family [Bacteroidota bacterium]REK35002.1 MAG: phosphate ABC transporter substrate-binding protein, PhoT family [Bacteroidota bacterium]REK48200.1 MAG: phosphate ABC transporter substrate-binding protein, PhoT family [Bacteroidota bacterium]
MKVKASRIFFLFVFLVFGLLTLVCCKRDKSKYSDTPVSGEILIVADESYRPLLQVQLDTFHSIYKYAKINARYLPEPEAVSVLLNNDSARLVILNRELNETELQTLREMKIIPRVNRIAVDALAIMINPDNKDSLFTPSLLGDIFSGKISTWNQLGKNPINDSIRIVFDGNSSSNARYLKEKFLGNSPVPSNWYALESNEALVDYVSNNVNALGVISLNWISDRENPEVNSFLSKVTIAGVSETDSVGSDKDYYKPFQAYIALKKYPFTRDVYIISREGRNGLGTGFASFVAGDHGQRIIRLMGLLPATMPIRIVKINE